MKRSGQVFSGGEVFDDIWNAIEASPVVAANLRMRSALMLEIARILTGNQWTQAEAATHCGIFQPRVNALLRGRINNFSLDALVNITAALGRKVRIEIEAA